MSKVISFLDNYYQKAIKLSNDFSITRAFEWTPLLILNELSIQIGHIYNIVYQSEAVNEPNRSFNNLGDELSDVFLQLIALADSLKINMYDIKDLKPLKEDSWLSIPVLFGQLNESIMEKFGFRFSKPRSGFNDIDDFIKNRILRLFDITYQIAEKYHLDIEKEFELMLIDANAFLERYAKTHKKIEFIDTYNESHQFIGKFEKLKAHQLGLWHDVFGCLIFNPITNDIFFQLKNHNHNGINKNDLLEITSGGHLQSGERIEDGVREVKEETGLIVSFQDMIYSGTRKCDNDNNMIIREFQHFYLLPLNVTLQDFKPLDDEVIGFVKVNIDNVLNVINNNAITIGTLNANGTICEIKISKNSFDSAFVNNGVIPTLLLQVQEYMKNQRGLKNEIK